MLLSSGARLSRFLAPALRAELIKVLEQVQLWVERYERKLAGIPALQSEVARVIARQINVALTPEQESRLTSAKQVSPDVYEAYLKGMFYVSQNTPESFEKGILTYGPGARNIVLHVVLCHWG